MVEEEAGSDHQPSPVQPAAQTLCSPSAAQTKRAKQRMLISLLNFIFTTQKLSLLIFYFLLFVLAGRWNYLSSTRGDAV